jgi:hypothetical protein
MYQSVQGAAPFKFMRRSVFLLIMCLIVCYFIYVQAAAKMLKKDKKAADASTDSTKKIA